MKPEPREIAFHEAAHAVIGRYFGYRLGRIWIAPEAGEGGADVYSACSHQALILAASTACLEAFEIAITPLSTAQDDYKLQMILSRHPPPAVNEDDDQWLDQRIQSTRTEAATIFKIDSVRAAVQKLAQRVIAERQISGAVTEALIDSFLVRPS